MEVGVKTGLREQRVEGSEVFSKAGLEDGAREKSVSLVTWREGAMGTPPVGWVLIQRAGVKRLEQVRSEGTRET